MLPVQSIQIIAQSMGYRNMKEDVIQLITHDTEHRLRQVISAASKFMKHSRRRKLTCKDISYALDLKNVPPVFGYVDGRDRFSFQRVDKVNDVWYIPDEEIDLLESLSAPLEGIPVGPDVEKHWLAVGGVQPTIPQNPIPSAVITRKEKKKKREVSRSGREVKVPEILGEKGRDLKVKHVLSEQLIIYYDQAKRALLGKNEQLKRLVLRNLEKNAALHELVPYIVEFVAKEISQNLHNIPLLRNLLGVIHAFLNNPRIHLELYVNQIITPVLQCIFEPYMGESKKSNHWDIRNLAAYLLGIVHSKYGSSYKNLAMKIEKTLIFSLLDSSLPLCTHYGALRGIYELGPKLIEMLLLQPLQNSNIELYFRYAESYTRHRQKDKRKKKSVRTQRTQALRCINALKACCGVFFSKMGGFICELNEMELKVKEKQQNEGDVVMKDKDKDEDLMDLDSDNEEDTIMEDRSEEDVFLVKRDMMRRLATVEIPKDVNAHYLSAFKMFGEAILPHIDYHIVQPTRVDINLMDMII